MHPQQLEWAAAEVEGVRKGAVVAFSVPSPAGERAVVVLEADETQADRIAAAVPGRVRDEVGVVVSAVTCVPRGSIPKTSSGKLRRAETRQRWLDGTLTPEPSRPRRGAVRGDPPAGPVGGLPAARSPRLSTPPELPRGRLPLER